MKTFRPRVIGVVLLTATLLVAICIQVFWGGLIQIDQHPITPPEIAARGGVVTSVVQYSFAILPLALTLLIGIVCLVIKKRDETPVA